MLKRISLFNQSAVPESNRLSLLNFGQEQFSDCPLSTARSCESLFNKVSLPEAAGPQERTIHSFLDNLGVNQVNVKEFIESLQRIESPNVKKLLNQQPIQPNLKDRRKLKMQAPGTLNLSANTGGGLTARSSPCKYSLNINSNKSGNES